MKIKQKLGFGSFDYDEEYLKTTFVLNEVIDELEKKNELQVERIDPRILEMADDDWIETEENSNRGGTLAYGVNRARTVLGASKASSRRRAKTKEKGQDLLNPLDEIPYV